MLTKLQYVLLRSGQGVIFQLYFRVFQNQQPIVHIWHQGDTPNRGWKMLRLKVSIYAIWYLIFIKQSFQQIILDIQRNDIIDTQIN